MKFKTWGKLRIISEECREYTSNQWRKTETSQQVPGWTWKEIKHEDEYTSNQWRKTETSQQVPGQTWKLIKHEE